MSKSHRTSDTPGRTDPQAAGPQQPNEQPLPVNPRSGSGADSLGGALYRRALLLAAGQHLLKGDLDEARSIIHQVLREGLDARAIADLPLSIAYTSLGRASIHAERPEAGVRLLGKGLELGVPGGATVFQDLLVAEAERIGRDVSTREAVQRWQDIVTLLGEETPESVYYGLSEAYARNDEGFGGSEKENYCWGDVHKHEVLRFLYESLEPGMYLEIGVDQGISLACATGPAVGVDPRPRLNLKAELQPKSTIISKSSDAFFRDDADALLQPKPDLVFIDGMHLFEFALRDFINVERCANPTTIVVVDDIFPCHPTQAARRRRSGAWTGDVWKLHQILHEERPDLTLLALNSYTTGLLLIVGLDPSSTRLQERYDSIVRRFIADRPPGPNCLSRAGALPSDHPVIKELVEIARVAREQSWTVERMQNALSALRDRT